MPAKLLDYQKDKIVAALRRYADTFKTSGRDDEAREYEHMADEVEALNGRRIEISSALPVWLERQTEQIGGNKR